MINIMHQPKETPGPISFLEESHNSSRKNFFIAIICLAFVFLLCTEICKAKTTVLYPNIMYSSYTEYQHDTLYNTSIEMERIADDAVFNTQRSITLDKVASKCTAPIVKDYKRHFISLAYSLGLRENGINSVYTTLRFGGTTIGDYSPRGHQSMALGYQYKVTPLLEIHGALTGGIGYLNGEQTVEYVNGQESGTYTGIQMTQSQWGGELMANYTVISKGNFVTELGTGGAFRSFQVRYQTDGYTTAETNAGSMRQGQIFTFQEETILAQAQLRFSYCLPNKSKLRLAGIYQYGEYQRPTLRFGYSYPLN